MIHINTLTKRTLNSYLNKWQKGKLSKSAIERELGITGARGKFITRAWESRLGLDTRFGTAVPLAQS